MQITHFAASASGKRPDLDRAFALGAAVAVNLAALGALAVMQPAWEPGVAAIPKTRSLIAEWIEQPPLPPPVPLAPPRRQPIVAAAPVVPITRPVAAPAQIPVPAAIGILAPVESIPLSAEEVDSSTGAGPAHSTPGAVSRDAGAALPNPSAPPYPIAAIRQRHEGTVLLEVRVDANGAVTEVRVLRGSGHRELDRSAREHVLRAWAFQPALKDGVPVAARVRIPIEFSLAQR